MNKFQINCAFQAHLKLLQGSYFRDFVKIQGATIVHGPIASVLWNYVALINTTPAQLPSLITEAKKILEALGKKPAFYVEPSTEPVDDLTSYLASLGFKSTSSKWMFQSGGPRLTVAAPKDLHVVRVTEFQQFLDFLAVFNQAYEPINAEYGRALVADFLSPNQNVQTAHFIAYLGETPVAISTYLNMIGYGGIYNVGTLPDHRKLGYASVLVNECVNLSVSNKDHLLFLQCEDGLEKYYNSLGFQTEFTSAIWYVPAYSTADRRNQVKKALAHKVVVQPGGIA